MKKIFIEHILLIQMLTLLFATTHLSGMDQIILEYPELTNFIDSHEFKEQIAGCEIITIYKSPEQSNHVASFDIEINLAKKCEIRRKIVINTYYINKNLLNEEELKFILCHELGHLHDKNLIKSGIIYCMSLIAIMSGTTYCTIKSLLEQEWGASFKPACIGCGLYLLAYLVSRKFARDNELIADEYALKLTKSKDAAISALQKRQFFNNHSSSKYKFINYLRS